MFRGKNPKIQKKGRIIMKARTNRSFFCKKCNEHFHCSNKRQCETVKMVKHRQKCFPDSNIEKKTENYWKMGNCWSVETFEIIPTK